MTPTRDRIALLAAAMRAYDRVFGLDVELVCCGECGATWHGYAEDECDWCAAAEERQRRWQAEMVLTAPDVDPEDIAFDGATRGWADRLAVAVEAELITREQAERAWRRSAANDVRRRTQAGFPRRAINVPTL